jgi:hypothetical protein
MFFLSRWEIKDENRCINLYPFIDNIECEFPKKFVTDVFSNYKEFWGAEKCEIDRLLYEFQNQEFTRDIVDNESYLYKYTAYISKQLLSISFPITYDGILYQSIKRKKGVCNFAIKTEIIDKIFELCEVYLLGVPPSYSNITNDNIIEPIICKIGRYNKHTDSIKWASPQKEDFIRFSNYFIDI